jgi:hypothetical protein
VARRRHGTRRGRQARSHWPLLRSPRACTRAGRQDRGDGGTSGAGLVCDHERPSGRGAVLGAAPRASSRRARLRSVGHARCSPKLCARRSRRRCRKRPSQSSQELIRKTLPIHLRGRWARARLGRSRRQSTATSRGAHDHASRASRAGNGRASGRRGVRPARRHGARQCLGVGRRGVSRGLAPGRGRASLTSASGIIEASDARLSEPVSGSASVTVSALVR